MAKSLTLALYLATRTRAERNARRARSHDPERRGEIAKPRPPGPLIWFHTGQDDQAASVREFARRLRAEQDDLTVLLTTSAATRPDSQAHMISQLIPEETLPAIRRFLSHWTPDVAIWTEPDLRPALITETDDRDIPLFLIDARTARPDPQSWRFRRGMSGSLLGRFRRILTGDRDTATTLRRLGAEPSRLEVSGYLEEGTAAPPCNEAERDALARDLDARQVWLAAHASQAEASAVIAAHRQAQRRAHRLLLIVVPEDPAHGAAWKQQFQAEGQIVATRSDGQEPGPQTQVYIADTEQEMGLWYRLAPIAFLGQSLCPGGGVNPYEAAALGSAILHGPNVRRHRHAYDRLAGAGAARLARNGAELGELVEALLSPDVAASMAHGAWNVCSSGAEVTDRVKHLIFSALQDREPA